MGLEVEYQAVPDNAAVLVRARIDAAYSERIYGVSTFRRDEIFPPSDQVELELQRDVKSLLVLHPGLEHRNFDIDRQWDALTYLLSENRRQSEFEKLDLGAAAVLGMQEFPHNGAQGIPTRYSSSEDLRRIFDYLAPISRDDLFEHYDLAKMKTSAVYKMWNEDGYDIYLWRLFEGLRDFYQLVLSHNEGVLVFTD